MEDWAEIRRLHWAEGVPIKEISRRMGVARNTVRSAFAADRPRQAADRRLAEAETKLMRFKEALGRV